MHESMAGGVIGADHVFFPGLRGGVMVGMGTQAANIGANGKARTTFEEVAVTADYVDGKLFADGLLGFSFAQGTTMRATSVPGATATAIGKPKTDQILLSAEVGYAELLDDVFSMAPFVQMDFVSANTGAYSETGAGVVNLAFASRTTNSVRSVLGTRLNGVNVDVFGTMLTTELKLAWAHQLSGRSPIANASFAGTITTPSYGVYLESGGKIVNDGLINSGAYAAMRLAQTGTIINNAGGVITGFYDGAQLFNGGTVINLGSIGATGTSSNGVYIKAGGFVTNGGTANSAALITGGRHGVYAKTGTGTVTNFGTINGNTAGNGIYLKVGGTVFNSGTLSSINGGRGIRANNGALTVTNQGVITGSGNEGILLGSGGTVTNSGSIWGGDIGVSSGGTIFNLLNTGTISAANSAITTLTSTNVGTIVNGSTSNNTAMISAGGAGKGIDATGAVTITNFGTITASGSQGIFMHAGGSITNYGLISGNYGVRSDNSTIFNLTNYGRITASNGEAVNLDNGGGGTITNNGTAALITGAYYGVAVYNYSGTVINSGRITSSGNNAVFLRSGGSIGNSGIISGYNTGARISGSYGTVFNSGTITGDIDVGVYLGNGGVVTNSGAIKDAVSSGISLANSVLTNNASGSLIGGVGARISGTTTLTNYGTITGTGGTAVSFNTSSGTLILGTGSKINGTIDGGGGTTNTVRLVGSGTLASNLNNFGAGSSLTVASGANWTASGTWTMPTVINSGTLQPGVSGTPLNVTGNFTQTSTGVLKSVLTSSGGASLLNITGNATLAGSVLVTPPASITTGTQKYTILTASGTVTGTFSGVSGGTALLTPSLSYDAKHAFVTLTQQAVAQPTPDPQKSSDTQTENKNAFAQAFDAAYAANPALFAPILGSLNQIKTQEDLNEALNQLTGENATAVANMIQGQVNEFLTQFQQHSQGSMGVTEVDDPWITAFFQSGNFRGNDNANQLTENAWGVTAGADHVVSPGFRIGVMGGIGQQNSNTRGAGSAKVWYEQLVATADWSDGAWYLNGLVGMSFNHGSTMRGIALPGLTATALGHLTSTQVMVSGQAGYGVPLDAKFTLVPFVGVDISVTDQDAYTETGAGLLNLAFAGRTINNQRSILGAHLKGANVDVMGLALNTELKMGWAHQFARVNPNAVAAFASAAGPSFTVTGAPLARDAGVIGFQLATPVASNASIHLRYDGEFSGISSSNTISFGASIDW